MANKFWRLPIENGDENTWAQYVLAQEKNAIGDYTSYLYDDSGALKLKIGRIGIDNGSTSGVVINDTEVTISLAGVTNGIWAKIEMTVSGITPTYAAADIVGATNNVYLPSAFKDSWVHSKGGFYITSTKRVIGIVYKNSSGNLAAIINQGAGYSYAGYFDAAAGDQRIEWDFKNDILNKTNITEIGDWNMNSSAAGTNSILLDTGLGAEVQHVRSYHVIIRDDSNNTHYPLYRMSGVGVLSGGVERAVLGGATPGVYELKATTGRAFDTAAFDSTSYNRGWMYEYMREET